MKVMASEMNGKFAQDNSKENINHYYWHFVKRATTEFLPFCIIQK